MFEGRGFGGQLEIGWDGVGEASAWRNYELRAEERAQIADFSGSPFKACEGG